MPQFLIFAYFLLKVCYNDNPSLTLSCLTEMSSFATLAFILENVIMIDAVVVVFFLLGVQPLQAQQLFRADNVYKGDN